MDPRPLVERLRSRSARTRSCPGRWRCALATALTGVCAVIVLVAPALARGAAAVLTPPPAPPVAPIVGGEYANDLDENRIDDRLQARSADVRSGSLTAQAADSMVSVELIFAKPVTQSQIDGFAGLGGTITYLYRAVSYGWIGRIPLKNVEVLPAAMGPSLVLVEPTSGAVRYSDKGTLAGRVRPIWKSGFAGNPAGFGGDPNTTIGFADTGVDSTHKDLAGRCVYWNDLTDNLSPVPVDDAGHGTKVTGIACGTGVSGGANTGPFTFTYADPSPWFQFYSPAISLPAGSVTLTSRVSWTGPSSRFSYVYWPQGVPPASVYAFGSSVTGSSPLNMITTANANSSNNYAVYLDNASYLLDNVVAVTTVPNYPGVGDGFNRFRGVAPGCNYAMVTVPEDDAATFQNGIAAAIDLLVANRIEKNIKIISLSMGLTDDEGLPKQSTSLRNKVNSAVNSGVIVVSAAGNSASRSLETERTMADPPRAALAITVGASNDKNALTEYSTYGFAGRRLQTGEDYKPDLIAPGGSWYYTGVIAPDSGTSDALGADKQPDDYAVSVGTSFSSPFVSGSAALIIQALERTGTRWDFTSSACPRFVKMLLCATASETNANREGSKSNPTLERAAQGPNGYPAGKDSYEGYGILNPDAAVEAVMQTYRSGATASDTFGSAAADRRAWARNMDLKAGLDVKITLTNPAAGDYDVYLYSGTPSDTGTPVLLAASTSAGKGVAETLTCSPQADGKAILVVKRVAGDGAFTLTSKSSGPPVASDVRRSVAVNAAATITLAADDDGLPNPPGRLTYTIASLPAHGRLEQASGGAVIAAAPTTLGSGVTQVVYRPNADWDGEDSFTYYAEDGGTAPLGGRSNTATVSIGVVRETSVTYQVAAGADDVHLLPGTSMQKITEPFLSVGQCNAGMRFTGVNIPRGARILRANLKVLAYTSGLYTSFTGTILAEAAGNAPDFVSQPINTLTLTTASQSWPLTTGWQPNTSCLSPDIANVIQEVINRSDWSANNALVIVFKGSSGAANDRKFWSYDGDPANAPQLEITYQP